MIEEGSVFEHKVDLLHTYQVVKKTNSLDELRAAIAVMKYAQFELQTFIDPEVYPVYIVRLLKHGNETSLPVKDPAQKLWIIPHHHRYLRSVEFLDKTNLE